MQKQLNQAMILTAGMSTRMRPLTANIPKILLPTIGKNLFTRMLDYAQAQHIQSVAMNLFHGKDYLYNEIDRSKHAIKVTPFEEGPIKGTGGGISGMQSFITDDHFAVINCDFLTEAILTDMFKFHMSRNALATLLLIPVPKTGKYGTVQVNRMDKKIMSFHPTVPQREIFAGIHIMSREIFKEMPTDHNFCIIENVYKPLIEKGAPIFAYQKNIAWHDLGEVKLYHDALFNLLKKPLPWMTDIKIGNSWIDPSVQIPPEVSYLNVILEKGVKFEGEGEGKIQDVIAFPNTTIKKGSYQHAILTPADTILDLHKIK